MYWHTKYKAAGYSWRLLRRLEFEVTHLVARIHPKKPEELHHVETLVALLQEHEGAEEIVGFVTCGSLCWTP